jgi:hypothetical protein
VPISDITSEPKQPARDEKNANTLCLRDPVSRLKLQASIRGFSLTIRATGKSLAESESVSVKPCQNVSHCAFFSNPVFDLHIRYPLPSLLYLPNTFFTSPTFRSTLPATFFAVPFTLSVLLEFMLLIRRRSYFGLSRLRD